MQREQAERRRRLERVRQSVQSDEALLPAVSAVASALAAAGAAISERAAEFEATLAGDRAAGEEVASTLRVCAQREATLQGELHASSERLTACEVRAQRTRDEVAEAQQSLSQLALGLGLEPAPAEEALDEEARQTLTARLDRLMRRREQLGPVNPLAQEEYAEAVEHVEELEGQRQDLESALRELQKLIADTDRQIRETFEQTFAAAAKNFEELVRPALPRWPRTATAGLRARGAGPCARRGRFAR